MYTRDDLILQFRVICIHLKLWISVARHKCKLVKFKLNSSKASRLKSEKNWKVQWHLQTGNIVSKFPLDKLCSCLKADINEGHCFFLCRPLPCGAPACWVWWTLTPPCFHGEQTIRFAVKSDNTDTLIGTTRSSFVVTDSSRSALLINSSRSVIFLF